MTLTRNWRSIDDLEILTDAQQLKLLGLFGEVWRKIGGYRLAAYQSSDPLRHGMLGIVAILDTDKPEQMVSEVRELADFIDGSRLFESSEPAGDGQAAASGLVLSAEGEASVRKLVEQLASDDPVTRQSAMVRLTLIGEPTRPFIAPLASSDGDAEKETTRQARRVLSVLDKAKKRSSDKSLTPRLLSSSNLKLQFSTEPDAESDRQVHSIEIEHTAKTARHQVIAQQMTKLLGPQWNRLRLVPFENHVLVLIGSDPELFRNAVASLGESGQSLQANTSASVYGAPLNPARGAEFHIDLALIRDVFSQRIKAPAASGDGTEKDQSPATKTRTQSTVSTPKNEPAANATGNAEHPPIDFSSLTFTIQDDYLSLEWRLPLTEIQAINSGM